MFSANLQETLGISWYEGAAGGAIPLVPDRLSYSEMALNAFKYPSEWTESYAAYEANRPQLCQMITQHIDSYDARLEQIAAQVDILQQDFFSGKILYETIRKHIS